MNGVMFTVTVVPFLGSRLVQYDTVLDKGEQK